MIQNTKYQKYRWSTYLMTVNLVLYYAISYETSGVVRDEVLYTYNRT